MIEPDKTSGAAFDLAPMPADCMPSHRLYRRDRDVIAWREIEWGQMAPGDLCLTLTMCGGMLFDLYVFKVTEPPGLDASGRSFVRGFELGTPLFSDGNRGPLLGLYKPTRPGEREGRNYPIFQTEQELRDGNADGTFVLNVFPDGTGTTVCRTFEPGQSKPPQGPHP